MADEFLMAADPGMLDFFGQIAAELRALFAIDRAEAVARLNHAWGPLSFAPYPDLVCHESAEYWAYGLYYGDVPFWDEDADRTGWRVRPLPPDDSPAWTLPRGG
ncbi:hypothetical protein OG455_27985 [Kitasatospora sp. NBC_01287]|uniref:hypothetical protein n=1 Tax=Kitasatospora sp. NBC_01287 TaxID=2903573 RepID=UPI002253762B|nr:hypothetical protein [Kitasatospora sp. NBC_01287]MCX4749302.1 hypothetical protein [Kitasatospora sp. NBC_01287]